MSTWKKQHTTQEMLLSETMQHIPYCICVCKNKFFIITPMYVFQFEICQYFVENIYSWIAYELQVGTSLGRRHTLVQFQIWGHFWIPRPKLHWEEYLIFFRKISKRARYVVFEKRCFPEGFQAQNRPFELKSMF